MFHSTWDAASSRLACERCAVASIPVTLSERADPVVFCNYAKRYPFLVIRDRLLDFAPESRVHPIPTVKRSNHQEGRALPSFDRPNLCAWYSRIASFVTGIPSATSISRASLPSVGWMRGRSPCHTRPAMATADSERTVADPALSQDHGRTPGVTIAALRATSWRPNGIERSLRSANVEHSCGPTNRADGGDGYLV